MTVETLLIYGLAAAGGWLLRHFGVGAALKTPGGAVGGAGVSPVTGSSRLSVMTTLKADIDQIVKSAVEAAVKQAIDDIKNAASKG
jgi:hypothetical protein